MIVKLRRVITITAFAVGVMAPLQDVRAAETVLTAVSGFPKGAADSQRFEAWVETLNERGKGIVRIDYKGGAPAIGSPFQLTGRVASGVFDMVSITGAYYTNVLPEADAFKLSELSAQELRQNGGYDYIAKLHAEKGLHYLGRHTEGIPFHLYLRDGQKLEKADLSGLKIRVTPMYRNFFVSLGATGQSANVTEIYTLMERGVVDGFGWPIQGIFDFSWEKVARYRVEPGFYSADINVLLNKKKWDELPPEARDFLAREMIALEKTNAELQQKNASEKARQDAAGIRAIRFSPAEEKKWLDTAKEAGWDGVIKASPEHGPALKKLLTK
ncbi:MAG: TRAP transporter substrate-binding protein DctP [Burkholderiaceae bacterium]|nr:TRAP transporter substrate-binding protein DctP [Burkholderiaceae bacterium]